MKSNIRVGNRYKLNAKWHNHDGKEVEVIMKRIGISDDYKGSKVYHIATDPDNPEFRNEDLDTEFLERHLIDIELKEINLTDIGLEFDDDDLKIIERELKLKVDFLQNKDGDPYIRFSKGKKKATIRLDMLNYWIDNTEVEM